MLGNDIYCKLLVYELYIKEGKGPIKALKDQKIPDIFDVKTSRNLERKKNRKVLGFRII